MTRLYEIVSQDKKRSAKLLAAFLLFAALLGVTRADASLPKAADVAGVGPTVSLQLVELAPVAPAIEPSRFGFAEDLALLAPESTPGRFGLFGLETRRFERTYARNNPLKYVDPNGEAWTVFTDAAAVVINAGAAVQSAGGSLNGGGPVGIAADTAVGTFGSIVQGFGDMLNLGTSTGNAIGSGGDSFDMAVALSADLGRASGIVLTIAGAAQSAGVPSTTIGPTAVTTGQGAVTVPGGYVRSIAENGQGVVYNPAGGSGNAGAIRVAGPNAQNPGGYARVYNGQGQPLNLATGKPGPNALTHPALTGTNTVTPVKVAPVPAPCVNGNSTACN